jgi:hypothetical protein
MLKLLQCFGVHCSRRLQDERATKEKGSIYGSRNGNRGGLVSPVDIQGPKPPHPYSHSDRGIGIRFPESATDFSNLQRVQTVSGANPISYQMGTGAVSLRL